MYWRKAKKIIVLRANDESRLKGMSLVIVLNTTYNLASDGKQLLILYV